MKSAATVALCVGHSRFIGPRRDGGAVSLTGASEWAWNADLAQRTASRLHDAHGILPVVINSYEGRGYSSAMRWLGGHLKELGNIRLAVELHFNSSDDPRANGHEWLYWHGSAEGQRLATALHREMKMDFPTLRPRGAKPLDSGDRGSEFLRRTHCAAVICEPFFGTHSGDWKTVNAAKDGLAYTLAAAIAACHPSLPS